MKWPIFSYQEGYSWEKALKWGNFYEHCNAACHGRLENRIVHALIAAAEFFPGLSQIISIFEKKIAEFFVPTRAQNMLVRALRNKGVKELYDQANATQTGTPWSIEFVDPWGNNGATFIRQRKILIESNLSDDEALSVLVFELGNAKNVEKFLEISDQARNGTMNREDYARENEKIEYETLKLHHELMKKVIEENNLDESLDTSSGIAKVTSFEQNWAEIQNSKHTNGYRQRWETITNVRN